MPFNAASSLESLPTV